MYQSGLITIKPISINACFQGRRFRTGEFKRWQRAVIHKLPKGKENSENIKITIIICLKCPLRSDLDNYAKPIIDCCVKAGLIKDDRYICEIKMLKIRSKKEGFGIMIEKGVNFKK